MPHKPKQKKRRDKDFELVKAINEGRVDLFYKLVERYEHKLYNFGLRMCGDPQDAEDVVQETFLNVFRYLKDFRYETKFKNWVYRIATSVSLKKRRKSKFAPDRELSLDEFLPLEGTSVQSELPAWASMPLDRLLSEELSNILKEAILTLPESYRLVIVLRDVEGFSTSETAQILNISPSNVKVRLHRARLFLREKLKDYFQ
jgi:RNA polymerase sigma-70 factor (ECF subfamily)